MFIDFTPEERKLQEHLRSYLGELVTEDARDEFRGGAPSGGTHDGSFRGSDGGGPKYREILKRLADDGWLGVGWPREFGGQGRPAMEQAIFFDEIQRVGFPIPFLTLGTVGPTLMKYGTEEQKQFFLPKILKGEMHFAIGYSEPGAGTDLASLTTKAVRDGDHYVITGQKIFTSLAEHADYVWLAVRTDSSAPKHKGISILMVDTKLPGFSFTPIHTLGGNRTNATYYDGVRVPASMLVGRENEGWKLITTQLNHERLALSCPGPTQALYEEVVDWARKNRLHESQTGPRVLDQPWVQENLARAFAMLEVIKLMSWRQASNIEAGKLDPAESSCVKVFSSESFVKTYQLLLEVLGPEGSLKVGSPGALLRGRIEQYYRTTLVFTFGGGVNEVQRDIIATIGLGMPRSR